MAHRTMRSPLLCLSILAGLIAGTASGELLDVDWNDPGDALITRDTLSGLDWLELTQSQGLAYGDVTVGTGGFVADGWRHATTAEVCGLAGELGLAPAPCPGTITSDGAETNEHVSRLGGTFVSGGSLISAIGLYDDGDVATLVGSAAFTLQGGSPNAEVVIQDNGFGAAFGDPSRGHFLVRDSPAAAVPLLTPTGVLGLLVGLGALGMRRTG